MKNVDKIIKELKKDYTIDYFAEKHGREPFKVLVSCIISLRTKDTVTYPAAKRLFELADTPKKMMNLKEKQIADAIYPAGFYKTKAERIKQISKELYEEHNSKVPDSIEGLVEFKGVGRKTANIVMVYGHNMPAVPVDVHVHKISNRLGWVQTKNPDQTEIALREKLPKKYWYEINELFVRHGQNICFTRNPRCDKCKISKYCKRVNVKTKYPQK